jgi:hypothetical protein
MRRGVAPRGTIAAFGAIGLRAVARLRADRSGATATVFAVSAIVIMGFVGLATEAGSWYLGRRDAQLAADAAAQAGALASFYGGDPIASAAKMAASNGFTDGGRITVAAELQAATGTNPNLPVKVTVSQQMVPLISSLFVTDATTIGATATAVVKTIGSACALATSGTLEVSGTMVNSGCVFASNSTSAAAINVTGTLLASSLTAAGGCCGTGSINLSGRPASPYHPWTINPYSAADALTLPGFGPASCDRIPDAVAVAGTPTITLVPYETSGHAYCSATDVAGGGDLVVGSGVTVAVPSGTYFFNNISLLVSAGGKIACAATCTPGGTYGTTFVFTGSAGTIGTVNITGGTVTLIALKTNAAFPALGGILFYGRGTGTFTIAQANSVGQQPIGGGIYFPNATVLQFTGNTISQSNCISLVAPAITLYSNARLDITQCATYGTSVAAIQGVRLVQ